MLFFCLAGLPQPRSLGGSAGWHHGGGYAGHSTHVTHTGVGHAMGRPRAATYPAGNRWAGVHGHGPGFGGGWQHGWAHHGWGHGYSSWQLGLASRRLAQVGRLGLGPMGLGPGKMGHRLAGHVLGWPILEPVLGVASPVLAPAGYRPSQPTPSCVPHTLPSSGHLQRLCVAAARGRAGEC